MDQWIKSVKEAGFKTAIFTVSHESGFFFHQSDATPYSMKALKWRDGKGDILRDFKASCKKYGIHPGVYIGTRWNAFFGVSDYKVDGTGDFTKNRQKFYNAMIEKTVKEIFANYGDWALVWFDGGSLGAENGGPDLLPIFKKYQPNGLFYHNHKRADMRWGGSETGTVPYPCWGTFPQPYSHGGEATSNHKELLKVGDPEGSYYMPAMSDAPLRGHNSHDWFWEPGHERMIYPVEKLVNMYYNSVGHNSTLVLGVTPNPQGLIPKKDVQRLKEFGEAIKHRFSNPLATTSGNGDSLNLKLSKAQKVNQLVVMEDIAKGERVRKFVIEGKTEKGWQTIFKGSCIGHKFIHKFKGLEASEVRVKVLESKGTAHILNFSAYNVK